MDHTAGVTHCMCGRGVTEGAPWDNDTEADGYQHAPAMEIPCSQGRGRRRRRAG